MAGCQGSERMKTIARFGALAVLAMAVLAFTSVGSATAPATTEERTTEVVLASFESGVIPTGVASSSDDLNCSDAAAMIRRLGTAIRDMESKLQDLKAKEDRLVQALRAIHQEMTDLQQKLDRVEAAYKQLEAEKQRWIQVLRDPNSTADQKREAMRHIQDIEAKQADLRVAAKRIHDRMETLRQLAARLLRELFRTERRINELEGRLDKAKQALHRLVAWYRANCP